MRVCQFRHAGLVDKKVVSIAPCSFSGIPWYFWVVKRNDTGSKHAMRVVSEFDSRKRKIRRLWKRRRWGAARLPFLPAIQTLDDRSFISPTARVDDTRQASPKLLEKLTPTHRKLSSRSSLHSESLPQSRYSPWPWAAPTPGAKKTRSSPRALK